MRSSRVIITAIVAAALAAYAPAGAAEDRIEEHRYRTATPLLEPACYITPVANPAFDYLQIDRPTWGEVHEIGGACTPISPDEQNVDVELTDDAGWPVSATIYFRDTQGRYVEDEQYEICARATIAIPPTAAQLIVGIEASNLWCALYESVNPPPTSGTIKTTFSS